MESFELQSNNQYILKGNCWLFPFCENVFVPGKSPVKVHAEVLDIFFLGKLCVVYKDWGARFSSCGKYDMDQLGFISFYSPFLTSFLLRLGWQWLDNYN
jgi:hypothetical protein